MRGRTTSSPSEAGRQGSRLGVRKNARRRHERVKNFWHTKDINRILEVILRLLWGMVLELVLGSLPTAPCWHCISPWEAAPHIARSPQEDNTERARAVYFKAWGTDTSPHCRQGTRTWIQNLKNGTLGPDGTHIVLRLRVYLQVHVQMLACTRMHTHTHTHMAALDTETGETPDAACSLPKILQLRLLKKCKTGGPCISPSKVANPGFPIPGSAGARAAAPCAPLPTHA
ncbi:uncharacterized protein LOC114220336 isoform X1 [Eumetopias jubatus]|uniref:uncharacterized protein LOC114220336 isoform X1 n=1 Tax=Eumetopias jubatus TaxID=34886 RepID=UPI0010169834|nr:uncharacterized protein LOC114220336 isoform X1 [Eumetopias jubatus]